MFILFHSQSFVMFLSDLNGSFSLISQCIFPFPFCQWLISLKNFRSCFIGQRIRFGSSVLLDIVHAIFFLKPPESYTKHTN